MDSPHQPAPHHLASLGETRTVVARMVAAAVAIVGLVVGLLAYSATQEDPDDLRDAAAYQQVDVAPSRAGGGSGEALSSFWVDAPSPGATVRLDGDSVGVVPAWVTGVEEGLRRVQVIAPGGSTIADTTVWVAIGTVADLNLAGEGLWSENMESTRTVVTPSDRPAAPTAAVSTGAMRVTSSPSGASVTVDGRRLGRTPLSLQGVSPGRYSVTVRQAGYEPITRSVDVLGGGTFETAVTLRRVGGEAPAQSTRPEPPPTASAPSRSAPPDVSQPPPAAVETGEVEVLVRPWGQIVIDGAIHQRESDVLYRTTLAPGTHRVVVSHPELGSQERTVTIAPGGRVRVEVDLRENGS